MDFREIWGELGSKMEWAVEKIHILRADVFTLWLKRPLYSQMRQLLSYIQLPCFLRMTYCWFTAGKMSCGEFLIYT